MDDVLEPPTATEVMTAGDVYWAPSGLGEVSDLELTFTARRVYRVELSKQLHNTLQLHGLLTHRALQLLSLAEIKKLWAIGWKQLNELMGYYAAKSIEPRDDSQSFVVRATAMYGNVNAVPASLVLALAFPNPGANGQRKFVRRKARYNELQLIITAAGITTLEALLAQTSTSEPIPGLSKDEHAWIRAWFVINGLC